MSNKSFAPIAAAALIALLAASCSSSDDPASATSSSTSEPAADQPVGDESTDPVDEPSDDATSTQSSVVASDYLGSDTIDDEAFGTQVTVTVAGDTRTIESNSLPDHETGEFPNAGNPNTISEQSLSYEFPVEPVFTGDAGFAQTPGVGVNGIAFEPGTGESIACESGENYRIEALQDLFDLGLDVNNAHVQPQGQYHYHGVSQMLVEAYASDDDLVHVGFAADGHLMYYSKSGAYASAYALSDETRTGESCTYRSDGVDIDGTTPDGTYVSDWVHDESNGDLDSCNGTTIDGEYLYVVTDEYPFIPRCLNGESTQSQPGPPAGEGAGGPPAGGPTPE